jgi:uncharacterized membrane protein
MKTKTIESLVEKPALTKESIILFGDAIFSIAITLLALEVRLPEGITHENIDVMFVTGLIQAFPRFLGFLISFFVLASYWMSFHKVTGYMRRFDRRSLWLTIVFLFMIALMPFPTAILGDFGDKGVAVVFYQVIASITSAILLVIWLYGARGRKLVDERVDRRIIGLYSLRLLMPAAIFLITIPLTLYNPVLAELSWVMVLPLSYIARAHYKVEDPRFYE